MPSHVMLRCTTPESGSRRSFRPTLSTVGVAAALGTALLAGPVPAAPPTPTAPSAPAPSAITDRTGPVTLPAAPVAASSRSAAQRRAVAVRAAGRVVGVPYRRGGTTPRGFDCSGLTRYVWAKAGKALPRTSRAQRAHLRRVSRAQARPGDLVFFHSSSGRVYHVGVYVGGGRMIDSPKPGRRVTARKIWSSRVSFGRV